MKVIELDIGISKEGTKKLEALAKTFGFRNKLEFIEAIADGRLEVVTSKQTEEKVYRQVDSRAERYAEKARDHAITELDNAIATLRSFQDDIRNLKRASI
jgi:DNA polymerase/3'-5' exonuclease PolX